MSDKYNIRDFRNAGTPDAAQGEKSNRAFYSCVVAIPIIAVLGGLAYKPMMELRGNNVTAFEQAQLETEANRRAEDPLYALKQDMKSDGLIDSNKKYGSGKSLSPEAKARKDLLKRALSPKEFLGGVDAKAHGFNALQMETLKYKRVNWALAACRHTDMRNFYIRQNKAQYEKLQAALDESKAAKAAVNSTKEATQAKKAEKHFNQMKNIETKSQAMAFVASGGAGRHMDAIGGFDSMTATIDGAASYTIRSRKQRFNPKGCSQVRTIVQSGTMRIKPNVKLK